MLAFSVTDNVFRQEIIIKLKFNVLGRGHAFFIHKKTDPLFEKKYLKPQLDENWLINQVSTIELELGTDSLVLLAIAFKENNPKPLESLSRFE